MTTNTHLIDQKAIKAILKAYKATPDKLINAFKAAQSGWSPVTVTYISDNGGYPDLAEAEIALNLRDINRILATLTDTCPPQIYEHNIPPQDWRAGAFDLAQLARYRLTGPGNLIFINCAPRIEQRGVENKNTGEDVYCAFLENGTIVAGVGAHSFTFFRDLVDDEKLEIFKVNVQTKDSQFRSRDFFPWFTQFLAFNLSQQEVASEWREGLTLEQRRKFLAGTYLRIYNDEIPLINTKERLQLSQIPQIDTPVVVRIDTHGNLKLSLSASDVKPEWHYNPLKIRIGSRSIIANLKDSKFDTKTGLSGLAPGSSGAWRDSSKPDPRFLELDISGDSLRDKLGLTDKALRDGVQVFIEPAEDDSFILATHEIGVFPDQGAHI